MLVGLVRALDAGDHEAAATRAKDATPHELAAMWTELTDSFGPLEDVGQPTVDGREASVPLVLGGQAFVACGRVTDERIEAFRITLSDDAGALSVLAGRLRGALSKLVDPFVDGRTARSEAADRLATASDPGARARAAVDLLAADRYRELAGVLDSPGEDEDPETVATAIERTWTTKVPSYDGVVRTASGDDVGYAFVDGGDAQVRVEVVLEDGAVHGLLLTTRTEVAEMLASRVFRGDRFDDLPEAVGDGAGDTSDLAESAERAWRDLHEAHGEVRGVGEGTLADGDAVVEIEFDGGTARLRVGFDERWEPSRVALVAPDGSAMWQWDGTGRTGRSGG